MIKFATDADKNRIIELWTEIFGDSVESVEQFLGFFSCEYALGYYVNGKLVSFMFLPKLTINCNGKINKANYIYALCTAREFRSKGYANALIKYSQEYSAENSIPYTLIRPSSDSLFNYYSASGFEREYYRVKKNLTIDADLLYNSLDNDSVAFAQWGSDGEGYAAIVNVNDNVYSPCVSGKGERYLMIRRNQKDAPLFDCVYMGLTFE